MQWGSVGMKGNPIVAHFVVNGNGFPNNLHSTAETNTRPGFIHTQ
jgi:hypothetical protein